MAALTAGVLSGTIEYKVAFASFGAPVVWFVVIALFIAQGFKVTGLGRRIALFFTGLLGRRTLGLSYGLIVTDLLLAPMIPSVTGRVAGIVFPVLRGVAESFGSHPNDPSARKMGSFLTLTTFQGCAITSAMFLTAMAANPLIAKLVQQNDQQLSWLTWAEAAILPGLASLILMPILVYVLVPPEIKETPNAKEFATGELEELGPMRRGEWITIATLVLLLVLWIFGGKLGVPAAVAGFFGLCILLITRVLSWNELIKLSTAWDTLIWFSILLMLAGQLGESGVVEWFSSLVKGIIPATEWPLPFAVLLAMYFYAHYFFASATAHVAAMFVPFLVLALGIGAPPMLAVLSFAYASSLFGGLTNYSLAPAPLLFGVGYTSLKAWWGVGFAVSLLNFGIWFGLGPLWWKALGLW